MRLSIVLLYHTISVTIEKDLRNMKLLVLLEAMQTILQPLISCVRTGCMVHMHGKTWRCHLSLIWYWYDIPKRNGMPEVKEGGTTYSCICRLTA